MAANDRVGNVYLDVLPRGEGFNRGVQGIIDKAEKDAKFNVNANTDNAQKAVQKLGKQIQEDVGGGWQQAGVQAAVFTGSVYAIKAAIEGVVNKFSELFDGIAKARAGFNSILGAKAGENLLSQVRQFAIDSPFVTGELVQYSQQLLGVGKAANTIVPTLKNVGDIVASVGGDTSNLGSILYALTQIQTIGKLTGQDARQLQNQLVPITKYIAEYTGKSVADVKKLQEAGGVSSDIVFAAIQNQGKKVEGALNNSVRTIVGAKSVLSDTLQNFVQSNPEFNKIYDDLVKGIQRFAASISEPGNKKAIDDFLNSIGKLYQSLKPVIEGLGKLGASGGLTTLNIFTRTLSVLAEVLNAIPAPVLKLIGTTLAAIALIKTPVTLITYAEKIKQVTSGVLGSIPATKQATVALNAQTTALDSAGVATKALAVETQAANAQTSRAVLAYQSVSAGAKSAAAAVASLANAEGRRNAISGIKGKVSSFGQSVQSGGGARTGLAVGAGLAGGLLQSNTSEDNQLGQSVGGALTYGAIGLSVAGPIGGAVGLAFGAVNGFLDANEARLQKQIQINKDLGRKAAEAYLLENEKLFSSATSGALGKAQNDLTALQKQRDLIYNKKYDGTSNTLTNALSFGNYGTADGDVRNQAVASIDEQIRLQKEARDKLVDPVYSAVDAAKKAGVGNQFFVQGGPTAGLGALTGQAKKSFAELDVEFRKYGVSIAEVGAMGSDAFVTLVEQINGLDTAQKNAVMSANVYAEVLKNAKGDSSAIYDKQISNLGAQSAAISALETAKTSAIDAATKPGTAGAKSIATITAENNALQAQSAARSIAYANSITASEEAISRARTNGKDILAKQLDDNKEELAGKAAINAENQVSIDIYAAQTAALAENTKARELSNIALEKAKILTDLQNNASIFSATTGATSAAVGAILRPNDPQAQNQAQIALIQAQETAGNAAATKASEVTKKTIADLVAAGFATDSAVVKTLTDQVTLEESTAKAVAAAKVLQEVERDSAIARHLYNTETVLFLTNLALASKESAILFGDNTAKAQAEAGFFDAITSAASAAVAVFTKPKGAKGDIFADAAASAEKAKLEVAALTAKTSQFNAARASGSSKNGAEAVGQAAYDAIIQGASVDIEALTKKVEGINSALSSAEGRAAISSTVTADVTLTEAKLAEAQRNLAALDSTSTGFGPTAAQTLAAAEVFKQKHILDVLTGKAADDLGIFSSISSAAQGIIQPQLDSAAKTKADAAAAALKKWQDSVVSATSSLTDKLASAADNIASAAEKWVGSIKERTQYESAVSVGRLTKNATRQGADVTEIASGLANLRSRGVSDAVLKSLGIDSVADTKQVRKLVRSSDSDLAKLTSAVASRDALATNLATSEEDAKTRKNISSAILDAAKTLGMEKVTAADATGIANQFSISVNSDPVAIANEILSLLTGGKIGV